jgi:hypothetical protein
MYCEQLDEYFEPELPPKEGDQGVFLNDDGTLCLCEYDAEQQGWFEV